jgi:phosphate/sulfate permease
MATRNYSDSINLYDRRYKLQVDTLVVTELQIAFEVKRSLSAKTANAAEIKLTNLSGETRKRLQGMRDVFISLEAGYVEGTSVVFRGLLHEAFSAREGDEWVTTVSSQDAAKERKTKRIQKSFPAGTKVGDIIVACAKALEVGLGNVQNAAGSAELVGVTPSTTQTGYVASGDALSALDRVCRSCGIEWSIQDNQLQLLQLGQPTGEQGIVLSPESGLIGSPELGKGGVVRCRTLMIPNLLPGRRVELRTRHVTGVYRVETTQHKGDFASVDNWGIELELKTFKQ